MSSSSSLNFTLNSLACFFRREVSARISSWLACSVSTCSMRSVDFPSRRMIDSVTASASMPAITRNFDGCAFLSRARCFSRQRAPDHSARPSRPAVTSSVMSRRCLWKRAANNNKPLTKPRPLLRLSSVLVLKIFLTNDGTDLMYSSNAGMRGATSAPSALASKKYCAFSSSNP